MPAESMACRFTHSLLIGLAVWLLTGSLGGLQAQEQPPVFLPAHAAFQPQAQWTDQGLTIQWIIAPGYYLYRDKIRFSPPLPPEKRIEWPTSQNKTDSLGTHAVYANRLQITIPHDQCPPDVLAGSVAWIIHYQGCAESGYCYAPVEWTLPKITIPSQPTARISDTLWRFTGLGLLLAMTPCTWPMWPILSGLIVGSQSTRWRAFQLSAGYVFGMASAQGVIGGVMAYVGYNLQAYFQNPIWVGVQMVLLIGLAIGLVAGRGFSLIPAAWEPRIRSHIDTLQRRGIGGAVLAGSLSTLMLTPCTSAPLMGAISYLAQEGQVLLGACALFALGVGMGIPLLCLGTSLGLWLPRSGPWMIPIAEWLAIGLVGFALSLGTRLGGPPGVSLVLGGSFFIFVAWHIRGAHDTEQTWRRWQTGLAGILGIWGMITMIGGAMGHTDWYQPLAQPLTANSTPVSQTPTTTPPAVLPVNQLADLQQAIQTTAQNHRPAMVFFSAHWCTTCTLLKNQILGDPEVQKVLSAFQVVQIQADVSDYATTGKAMMDAYGVLAPPTILGYTPDGVAVSRLYGAIDKAAFLHWLQKLHAATPVPEPTTASLDGK